MASDNNLIEDKKLIENFLNGNRSAFNTIVLKYHKKIYWVVRRIINDHNEADDITQEVFIKLFSSLKNFRGESTLYTYLYKIAINLSLNSFNKNKLKLSKEKPIDESEYNISDKKIDFEDFDNEIRTKIFKEALETLPAMQRTIFSMRFYDELSYEEISKILKKSVGGMKANYFHAFKKIQKFIINKKNEGYLE